MSSAGPSCGAFSVNKDASGLLDGVTIVLGHELAETQTDPLVGAGWYDGAGSEIADKCAWLNLRNVRFGAPGSFPMQPLWSNNMTSCVQ
jgi:uncharacterized protein YbbC (DUF1343 family)